MKTLETKICQVSVSVHLRIVWIVHSCPTRIEASRACAATTRFWDVVIRHMCKYNWIYTEASDASGHVIRFRITTP